MGNSLLDEVLTILKTDARLISEDGELLKNKTQELAYKLDPSLIGLLLRNPLTKERFFREIEGCLIFAQDAFVSFVMSKEFLPDSYTAYKNKIGLNVDGKTFDERKEVSLVWAYKDCVLAGGQDKEDSKRDEIFYNETLGSDQIDRLLDPKVFTEFKRIDKDGKHDLESFRKDNNGNITDNLIIKGNNLLALHSLKKKFKGKVKLIYIDPPYNTGNDGFRYNDRFNHSSWLTFMKNRLEVARELLKEDGVIFVQCDDNEQAYLKILIDEIFGRGQCDSIVWQKMDARYDRNTNAKVINRYKEVHEYILIGYKSDKKNYFFNKIKKLPDWNKEAKNPDKDKRGGYEAGILSFEEGHDNEDRNSEYYYSITLPSGRVMTRHFFVKKDEFIKLQEDNRIYFPKDGDGVPRIKIFQDEEQEYKMDSILRGFGTSSKAKDEIFELFNNRDLFETPKPEKLICELIRIMSKENDLVLDFFGGSGTTGAVAHKMGRQYILIEQMNYIKDLPEARLIKVIEGEQGGISESVGWKGGGNFVYMEIACDAERYIEMIRDAEKTDMLIEIWDEMKEKSFINYKLDPQSIDNTLEEFKTLPLEVQKRILIETIDKNALYKNLSEMNDTNSGVSEEDKKLNSDFYN